MLDAVHELVPVAQVGRLGGRLQRLDNDVAQAGVFQHQWHFVDGGGVGNRDDRSPVDVTEQRDLVLEGDADRPCRTADDGVGLDTDAPQRRHAVLGRLALELLGGLDEWHQRQVHVKDVLAAEVVFQLADRFQEGKRFDVADRPADFDDHDIGVVFPGDPRDAFFDLVGHVRDHLHRPTQVVATSLLGDHLRIDLAGGDVAGLAQVGIDEALVVTEVEVGLGAIVGDEHFPMLVGGHRARIDVDIGIELLEGDAQAAGLQDGPYGRRRDPLSDRGNHATGYEDVLRHRDSILRRVGVVHQRDYQVRWLLTLVRCSSDVVRSSRVSLRTDRQL